MHHSRARVMAALLYEEAHGRIPTIRAIGEATELSNATVYAHLLRLRRSGLVNWQDRERGTLHSTVAIVVPRVAS